MIRRVPASASVAEQREGKRLFAPSAERNTEPLCEILHNVAPRRGKALEIASGTGQHVIAFATCLPELIWQPTEPDADRRASIDAYAAQENMPNLLPAQPLDAAKPGVGRFPIRTVSDCGDQPSAFDQYDGSAERNHRVRTSAVAGRETDRLRTVQARWRIDERGRPEVSRQSGQYGC